MEQKAQKAKKIAKENKFSIKIYEIDGTHIAKEDLPAGIFGVTASDKLLAQYVRVYLANQRQGTHKTKKRGEVRASTKKIYKQKGTGRARHGARTAPIFVGGGVAHGVEPKSYALKLNKKQRKKALYYSLSLKRKEEGIVLLKGAEKLTGKTKEMEEVLKKINSNNALKTLFVYANSENATPLVLGLRNINHVLSTNCHLLNAYDVIRAQQIVFTEAGLKEFITFRGFK